jgi:putative redox protein
MVTVRWKGEHRFEAEPESGKKLMMDTFPEPGQETVGPTPFEAFLSGIAACSAYDVVHIMQKKKQKLHSYHVVIDGVRTEEGKYPRPYVSMTLKHVLVGEDLDQAAVEQAVKLSDEKYCSAIATLRQGPSVESVYEVHEAEPIS